MISFKVIAQNLSHGTAFCWRNSEQQTVNIGKNNLFLDWHSNMEYPVHEARKSGLQTPFIQNTRIFGVLYLLPCQCLKTLGLKSSRQSNCPSCYLLFIFSDLPDTYCGSTSQQAISLLLCYSQSTSISAGFLIHQD
jgi:hypothetical protein